MTDIASWSADAAWWSRVDHWALIVVVAGVVLEGIAEWLPRERRETPLMTSVTRTGWLILVAALVVEYAAQRNKDADDSLVVGVLNEQAAQFSKEAEAAKGQIAALKVQGGQLAADAETAKAQVAAANAQAASAKTDAARANERAKALENQGLELQKQVADAQRDVANAQTEEARIKSAVVWRHLSPSECRDVLAPLNGAKGSIMIEFPNGDPEAQIFGGTISRCFALSAGWQVSLSSTSFLTAAPLNLGVKGGNEQLVEAVRSGFLAAGYRIFPDTIPNSARCSRCTAADPASNPDVFLLVGSRPVIAP
jgi:hypothetical protein